MSHASESGDLEPFMLHCSGQSLEGMIVSVDAKGCIYSNGLVMWEVRRILQAFFPANGPNWLAHKVIKQDMGAVRSELERSNTTFWDVFRPSRRAYEQGLKDETTDEFVRDDYQVTSEGLLTWLATWSMKRHSTRDREQ
jgi:hypothetical protein